MMQRPGSSLLPCLLKGTAKETTLTNGEKERRNASMRQCKELTYRFVVSQHSGYTYKNREVLF